MRKRVSSFIMAIVMLFALLPLNAFAASTATFTIGDVEAVAGDTVTIPVTVSGLSDVYVTNIYGKFELTEGLNLVSVTPGSNLEGFTNGVNVLGAFQYDANDVMSGKTVSDGTVFTLEASVPDDAVEGSQYTVNMNLSTLADQDMEDITYTVDTGIITVGSVSTDPYTASISTTGTGFSVDDTVAVTVNVGGTTGSFASSELILTYDSEYLTFNKDESTLNDANVDTATEGTIKLVDHGETQQNGAAYVLNFTAKKATANAANLVTLIDAKFSTAANAAASNLIEATGENALELTIKNADLNVTLPTSGVVTGNPTVPYGEDYTFTAKNNTTYMYYNYVVSAKMGNTDVAAENIVNNNDGTWTIENVTDDLVISVTETPKTYKVTVDGDNTVTDEEVAEVITTGVTNGEATYNTAVTYTLPAGQAATDTVDGWHYTATVTVDGASYTASGNDLTYTIAGDKVTGDIVITLSKVVDAADSVIVSISGSNEIKKGDDYVTEFTATKNSEVTLTLVPETGYTYVINDGTENLTINDDNTFTVNVGTTAVTLTVTKSVDITNAKATYYLGIDDAGGKAMWLVTIAPDEVGSQLSEKHYTFKGSDMYWSSEYKAYCYLEIGSSTKPTLSKDDFAIASNSATAVDYGMDVNKTGKVDANDAQLVYNMYNKVYSTFDNDLTVEKFLRADVNADALNKTGETSDAINVGDAAAIVTAVLERMNGSTN